MSDDVASDHSKNVPFGKFLAMPISFDIRHKRTPKYIFGMWRGVRNNSAERLIGTLEGAFRAREIQRLEPKYKWNKELIDKFVGVTWRLGGGRWTLATSDGAIRRGKSPEGENHQARH